jgi:flagellar biosynthesis protein FliQ
VILGLAALLLLPGFLVVRARWTAVPFLSLFFWIASWWWLPSVGRGRFLAGALVAFALLAVFRLVRFEPARPSWPSLLAVAAALLRASAGLVPIAGAGTHLDLIPAQLMVWHDGLPVTYVPLREAGNFGAHPHGLDALAADLSLLSGVAVPRTVTLAAAVARGLSSLGVYALLVGRLGSGPAALITAGISVVVSLFEALTGGGDPSWSLALGFVLTGAGLLVSGRSRSGAVAAGAFVATALMTAPAMVAAGLAAGVVAVALAWTRISRETLGLLRRRLAVAAAAAIATGAPYVFRAAIGLARS